MENKKDDNYFLEKIKNSIDRINNVMNGVTYDEFVSNLDKQDIAMFNLIQISENAKQISEEYKREHKNIPWMDIYGLRNRIVHDYGNVELDIVYQTLNDDIPGLLNELF